MPDLNTLFPYRSDDVLKLFRDARAVYECPKDTEGRRLGPLVQLSSSNLQRPIVSDTYFNVGILEERMNWMSNFAFSLARELTVHGLKERLRCETVVGVPRGGCILNSLLALELNSKHTYLEKNPQRGGYHFSRSLPPEKNATVCIVDDVITTGRALYRTIDAIKDYGSPHIIAVCAIVNRTPSTMIYGIPIMNLLHVRNTLYDVNDIEVAEDIANGNVCDNPRGSFHELLSVMEKHNGSR